MTAIKIPNIELPDELAFVDDDIRETFEGTTYLVGTPTNVQLARNLKALPKRWFQTEVVICDTKIYIVTAYRVGHFYTVGAFSNTADAIECADRHFQYRGGRYVCAVEECVLNTFENDAEDYTTKIHIKN